MADPKPQAVAEVTPEQKQAQAIQREAKARRVRISGPSPYNPSDQVERLVTEKMYRDEWQAKGFTITSWEDFSEYLSPEEIKERKAAEKAEAT